MILSSSLVESLTSIVSIVLAGFLLFRILLLESERSVLDPLLFGCGLGAVVVFLWTIGVLPLSGTTGQNTDWRLFVGLIAIIVSIMTGVALRITYDQVKESRELRSKTTKEADQLRAKITEAEQTMENHQLSIRNLQRLLYIAIELANTASQIGQSSTSDKLNEKLVVLTYLMNIYTDPSEVIKTSDLSLDPFVARKEFRDFMNAHDCAYVRWLAEHFDSPIESVKREVREQAAKLLAELKKDDQSQI